MSNKKKAARRGTNSLDGSKQKYMDYPHGSTQDSVCQQSSFTQKYQTMKKEAQVNGWHCGKSLLSLKPEYAMKLLRQNGLHAWLDYDGNLYGPDSETKESTLVLAKAGDRLSIKIACEYFGASEQEFRE